MSHWKNLRLAPLVAFSLLFFAPLAAFGYPGGAPVVGFAQSALNFLTHDIGPVIFGIGLAIAALSLIVGSREGLSRAVWAIAGGAMLFSIGAIVDWVAGSVH